MKKLIFLMLIAVIMTANPSLSHGVLLNTGGTEPVNSNEIWFPVTYPGGLSWGNGGSVTFIDRTAPSGTKYTNVNLNIEALWSNSWVSGESFYLYVYLDGSLYTSGFYTGGYQAWSGCGTINFSFPSGFNRILITGSLAQSSGIGSPGNRARLNGTLSLAADVADNATIIQARDAANLAKTSADTASTRAQTSVNQTWYIGTYGGAPENVANLAGYIRIL